MTLASIIPVLAQLFRQPVHLPTNVTSLLWALPLCLCIALVYKAIKMDKFTLHLFFKEVTLLFATLIGFLLLAALVLLAIAHLARW